MKKAPAVKSKSTPPAPMKKAAPAKAAVKVKSVSKPKGK